MEKGRGRRPFSQSSPHRHEGSGGGEPFSDRLQLCHPGLVGRPVRCPTETAYRVKESEADRDGQHAGETFDRLNATAGGRLPQTDYEANRRLFDRELREGTGRGTNVTVADLAAVLTTDPDSARRSHDRSLERTNGRLANIHLLLVGLHTEILMWYYGGAARFALPRTVAAVADAYVRFMAEDPRDVDVRLSALRRAVTSRM